MAVRVLCRNDGLKGVDQGSAAITARADDVWADLGDIGTLHTSSPGFVVEARLEPGARIVRLGNRGVVAKLIMTVDKGERRGVWSAAR